MELVGTGTDRAWLGHARLEVGPHHCRRRPTCLRCLSWGASQRSRTSSRIWRPRPRRSDGRPDCRDVRARGHELCGPTRRRVCVAVLDPVQQVTIVATDAVGNYPIYWYDDHQEFVFSSALSAVLSAVPSCNRLNLMAVADYLTVGAVLEERTLVEGVRLLDPGTFLEFDWHAGDVRRHRYVDTAAFFADGAPAHSQLSRRGGRRLREGSRSRRTDLTPGRALALRWSRYPRDSCRAEPTFSRGPHLHAGGRQLRRSGHCEATGDGAPTPSTRSSRSTLTTCVIFCRT